MSQNPTDIGTLRKWLHQLANGLMPIGGVVSLMRLGRIPASDEQLQKLETSIEKLNKVVTEAREALKSMEGTADSAALYEISCVMKFTGRWDDMNSVKQVLEETKNNQNLAGFVMPINGYFFMRLEGSEQLVSNALNEFTLDKRYCQISVLSHGRLTASDVQQWRVYPQYSFNNIESINSALATLFSFTETPCSSDQSLSALKALLEQIQLQDTEA